MVDGNILGVPTAGLAGQTRLARKSRSFAGYPHFAKVGTAHKEGGSRDAVKEIGPSFVHHCPVVLQWRGPSLELEPSVSYCWGGRHLGKLRAKTRPRLALQRQIRVLPARALPLLRQMAKPHPKELILLCKVHKLVDL